MKQIKLNVSNREKVGGTTSGRYRKEGKIPAVIYGESGAKNLLIDAKEFFATNKAISGIAALLEVFFSDGTESRYAMIKEVSRNPITDEILHVDLIEVVRGKPMKTVVPFHVTGESVGAKNEGGVLEVHMHEIKITCRPRDLPESISHDVSDVRAGQYVHLKDIKLPEGVSLDMDGDRMIISCNITKAEASAADAAAAAAAPAAEAKKA